MKRPLLIATLFYILGIIIGQYIVNRTIIVLFFMLILLFSFFLYKKYKWKGIFIFPIFSLVGFILLLVNIKPKDNYIENLAKTEQNIKIYGIVKDIDYTTTGRQKIVLKANSIITENLQINKTIKVQAILELDTEVKYNQIILLEGNLQCFDFKRNPSGFNEKLYMQTRKIDYKMFAKLIQVDKTLNSFKLYDRLSYVYDNMLPKKEASILKAMVLGDKKNLDTSIKELYREAGISHILAISGLHITILSGVLWLILNNINKRISSIIILIVLILYCIFTGNSVSTVRAVTMIGIVLVGNIIYKEADIFTSIATSALFLLIYQPLYLYDVGFQLSFSAVIGIITLTPVLEKLYFIPKSIRKYLGGTLSASLATYPIVAYHFNTVSLIGILINIFVLPFVTILVIFGLLAGILGLIFFPLGQFLCGIIYYILIFYEKVCLLGSNIPFSQLTTGQIPVILICMYYSVLLIIAYYCYNIKSKQVILKKYVILIIGVFTLTIIFFILKPKDLEIIYLDVNQGDSIVIHTKNKNVLIDGGGNIRKEIDEPNTGSQIVLPYLKYKGINKLDCIFVSHPDGDHILGIIELIGHIKINQIVIADANTHNEFYIALNKKAEQYSIPILKMSKDDIINLDDDLIIECLYPSKNNYSDNINNNSLVLYIKYDNFKFAFTGDIEKEAETILIKDTNLEADILKVPHHGSKTSSTQDLLDNIKPKVAIISSGRNNSYGHPHKEVVNRYEAMNIKVYNTAEEGAIIIKVNNNNLKISTMKERQLQ